MLYPYIKANPKVAEYLGLATKRTRFADGNYLLWKFDLMNIGGNNAETLARIGAVGMSGQQARAEQKGETSTPLPKATDPRFIVVEDAVTEQTKDEEDGHE